MPTSDRPTPHRPAGRARKAMLFAVAAGLAAIAAGAAGADTVARPQCDEDRSTGEPPTISSRFDLKDPGQGGQGFIEAKTRALQYCAQQACTVGGQNVKRTASIYALAMLHRRYIAGFRCVPGPGDAGTAERGASSAPIDYRLNDPSEIDGALAKANERCASSHAKAELSDLQKKDGAIIAVFGCGS